MSVTPLEIDKMSLFQFTAMHLGWKKFHCAQDGPKAPSGKRLEEAMEEMGYDVAEDDDDDTDFDALREAIDAHVNG